MKRLTLDLRAYRNSGIGRYLRNLVPLLLPLIEADSIRVLMRGALLGRTSPAWLNHPGLEFLEEPAPIYSPREQILPLLGRYRDTSLLWVPHYNAPLLYTGPLAVTIHDLAPIALPETFSSPLKRRYARLLIERAVRRASAIFTVSQFTADELHRRLGVDPARITLTPPGLDLGWPTLPHAHPDTAAPYLLYVGNVKPNKNLKLLLTAFAQVLDRIPHRLVLAGRMRGFGTEDLAVIRQAESLGDRVHWTGEISDDQLIALYSAASALVMPSLYEGFGLPLLEAMQLNCPILSSNAASLPEVAGDAALFFDPHDSASLVRQLLQVSDSTVMDALRARGRTRIQHFSYTQCAHRTAAVLNRLLQNPT